MVKDLAWASVLLVLKQEIYFTLKNPFFDNINQFELITKVRTILNRFGQGFVKGEEFCFRICDLFIFHRSTASQMSWRD